MGRLFHNHGKRWRGGVVAVAADFGRRDRLAPRGLPKYCSLVASSKIGKRP